MTATTSVPSSRLRRPEEPRSRTSTVAGRIADDLELCRNVPELERHAHDALDDVLAGDGQPEERRQRDGDDLQAEVAEGVVGHLDVVGSRGRTTAAASLDDQGTQAGAELVGRQLAIDAAVHRQRDLAGLFRHDDRHGVSLLGEADGRAVASAELAAQPRIDGQAAGSRPPRPHVLPG